MSEPFQQSAPAAPMLMPADADVLARRYRTVDSPPAAPGGLNPDFRYVELAPERLLGLSGLAFALLEWCIEARSVAELLDRAVEQFPERGAVIEHELLRSIDALTRRGLLQPS